MPTVSMKVTSFKQGQGTSEIMGDVNTGKVLGEPTICWPG